PIDYNTVTQQLGGKAEAADYDSIAQKFGGVRTPEEPTNISPTGSAGQRFMSSAWDMVNPFPTLSHYFWDQLVKGEGGSHIPTVIQDLDAAHSAQANLAADAWKRGDVLGGLGHTGAAIFPVAGPVIAYGAEKAGTQFGEGDIAGGAGTLTGILGPEAF